MEDIPHPRQPADRVPPMPSDAERLAPLAWSEVEPVAGRIVSGDDVVRELDASIARMDAKRVGRTPRRTVLRR